jgi:hypothetical protein
MSSTSPRTILADDDADLAHEQAALAERTTAYDATFAWQGSPLQPYSITRESLYYLLRPPTPLQTAMQRPETFLADALILLYLCSHTSDQWQSFRDDLPRFHREIETWADAHVPSSLGVEAIGLALKIINTAAKTKAIARPRDKESPEEGNLPSP